MPFCFTKVLNIGISRNQLAIFKKVLPIPISKVLQYSGNTEKVLAILSLPIQYCNINNPVISYIFLSAATIDSSLVAASAYSD